VRSLTSNDSGFVKQTVVVVPYALANPGIDYMHAVFVLLAKAKSSRRGPYRQGLRCVVAATKTEQVCYARKT
jgi:hypothetical protein